VGGRVGVRLVPSEPEGPREPRGLVEPVRVGYHAQVQRWPRYDLTMVTTLQRHCSYTRARVHFQAGDVQISRVRASPIARAVRCSSLLAIQRLNLTET
jgi:hypothetical protein